METTKFIVIFNDNQKTTVYTNDIEKSKAVAELSKKFSYKVIETGKQQTEAEKIEVESTNQFTFNPSVSAINRKWQDTLILLKKWDEELKTKLSL